MPVSSVKIFGPVRSGTNLLRWILQHFPGVKTLVDHDQFGERCWKHGFPRPGADLHIAMRKDITSWYVSNRSFADPSNCPSQRIADYYLLNREYDRLAAERNDFVVIEYADLLRNWHSTIARIADLLGRPAPDLPEPGRRIDIASDGRENRQTGEPFNSADHYLEHEAQQLICPQEAKLIGNGPPGNPDIVHIKHYFNGLGDAVISAWVCAGLAANGLRAILYPPSHLVPFTRHWWPRYQVGPGEKAPEWAVDITSSRTAAGDRSHAETMWDLLPKEWTTGSRPLKPELLLPSQLPLSPAKPAAIDAGGSNGKRKNKATPQALPTHSAAGQGNRPPSPSLMNACGSAMDAEIAPVIILFPFSAHRLRQWPIEHWMRLAERLRQEFPNADIITAAPPDAAEDAARVTGREKSLVTTDLAKLIEHILSADLVISNDSAPAHIAGTLDVPTLAIHAVQPPSIFKEYPSVQSIFPEASLCAGCRSDESAGYAPAHCNPDALSPTGTPLSQPHPSSNPFGAVLGPGCPELKAISYSRVFRRVVKLLGCARKLGCAIDFWNRPGVAAEWVNTRDRATTTQVSKR